VLNGLLVHKNLIRRDRVVPKEEFGYIPFVVGVVRWTEDSGRTNCSSENVVKVGRLEHKVWVETWHESRAWRRV
jgi:hypothetical protein